MIKLSLLCLFLTLLFPISLVYVSETPIGIDITSEKDLSDYLLAQLGKNHGSMNSMIKQYVAQNQISILNALDELTLLLIPSQNIQPNQIKLFNITKTFISALSNSQQQISTHLLLDNSPQQIQKYIQQHLKDQHIQKINVLPHQIQYIKYLFNNNHKRILQQTSSSTDQTPQDPYIIKFFFSLLFIIVIFSSFCAIAGMENKKDTLLYAKFIAEVHNR